MIQQKQLSRVALSRAVLSRAALPSAALSRAVAIRNKLGYVDRLCKLHNKRV